jgi:hypothetical protein
MTPKRNPSFNEFVSTQIQCLLNENERSHRGSCTELETNENLSYKGGIEQFSCFCSEPENLCKLPPKEFRNIAMKYFALCRCLKRG